MTINTQGLAGATAALNAFVAKLPPETGADCVKVASDFATALKLELALGIDAYAPKIPLIGHFVTGEMIRITDETIDNAINALAKEATP